MHDLVELAIPAFLLPVFVEVIFDAVMPRDLYEYKDTAASLTIRIGNALVGLFAKAMVFGIFTGIHRFAPFHIRLHMVGGGARFFRRRLQLLLVPPRKSSMPPLLGVARRTSLLSTLQPRYCATPDLDRRFYVVHLLAMDAAGRLHPFDGDDHQSISLIYQFWIHTEVVGGMGVLEQVLNTPSHHRVHHGSNPQYIDRNHGTY